MQNKAAPTLFINAARERERNTIPKKMIPCQIEAFQSEHYRSVSNASGLVGYSSILTMSNRRLSSLQINSFIAMQIRLFICKYSRDERKLNVRSYLYQFFSMRTMPQHHSLKAPHRKTHTYLHTQIYTSMHIYIKVCII